MYENQQAAMQVELLAPSFCVDEKTISSVAKKNNIGSEAGYFRWRVAAAHGLTLQKVHSVNFIGVAGVAGVAIF
jgi:hypothetical protein